MSFHSFVFLHIDASIVEELTLVYSKVVCKVSTVSASVSGTLSERLGLILLLH